MTRRRYGGGIADWAFTITSGNTPQLSPNAVVTFWTQQSGGSQYTDLASAVDGSGAISQVIAGGGTLAGQLPVFYGPDEVTAMWASANDNPRALMQCNDGFAGQAMLDGSQTFTGTKTFGPTGNPGLQRVVLYAETVGQSNDLAAAYSGTDTGEGGTRQKTWYLNNKGELRAIAAKTTSVPFRVQAQNSQTANLLEQVAGSGSVLSWMGPDGSWRAPNLGQVLTWTVTGAVTVRTGVHRIYNDTGVTQTIRAVRTTVNTAPTGAAIRIDVNKNGTTIFTTQGNRPNIAISGLTSKATNMDVTTLADGDYLTYDIDQIGSTVAGSDLLVQVLVY